MSLKNQGPHSRANQLISIACSKVFDDEFGHMLKGIAGLDAEGLQPADWRTLEAMSVEQLKARILMRNAQFGHPLAGKRLEDALSGRCGALSFDYERAEEALQ